jgi:hypothetical protein
MRMNNEGRRAVGLLIALSLGGPCLAQQYAGVWSPPFDHQVASLPIATDPGAPWGGLAAMSFYSIPIPPITWGWPTAGTPQLLSNGDYTNGKMFNALHMCLIPKGVHQGKVLVWNDVPVVADPGAFAADPWWSFQAYAIVDPMAPAGGLLFENFLLPIRPAGLVGPSVVSADNLFCAGHAWSRHGDLIVAGGTNHNATVGAYFGTGDTFSFNPSIASAPFPLPGQTALYATSLGHWSPGPALNSPRWYPTVTHTARLPRVAAAHLLEGEVMLVTGGSARFPYVPGAPPDPEWNTYEALKVVAPTSLITSGLDFGSPSAGVGR